jgi:hypothetical protein
MAELSKWRVFCVTENGWSYGWLETGSDAPTTCFNNTSHQVNTGSISVIDTTENLTVKIKQETVETGGNFKSKGYSFVAGANTSTTLSVSWPYPVTACAVHIQTTEAQMGDVLNAIVGPKTIVGVIVSPAYVGNTVVSVNSTVFKNSYVGYEAYIGSQFVGEILELNPDLFTVKFSIPLTVDLPLNSYFKIQMRIIDSHMLGHTVGNDIGATNIGGKSVPKNLPTHVIYKNNSDFEKTFCFTIEYLY